MCVWLSENEENENDRKVTYHEIGKSGRVVVVVFINASSEEEYVLPSSMCDFGQCETLRKMRQDGLYKLANSTYFRLGLPNALLRSSISQTKHSFR